MAFQTNPSSLLSQALEWAKHYEPLSAKAVQRVLDYIRPQETQFPPFLPTAEDALVTIEVLMKARKDDQYFSPNDTAHRANYLAGQLSSVISNHSLTDSLRKSVARLGGAATGWKEQILKQPSLKEAAPSYLGIPDIPFYKSVDLFLRELQFIKDAHASGEPLPSHPSTSVNPLRAVFLPQLDHPVLSAALAWAKQEPETVFLQGVSMLDVDLILLKRDGLDSETGQKKRLMAALPLLDEAIFRVVVGAMDAGVFKSTTHDEFDDPHLRAQEYLVDEVFPTIPAKRLFALIEEISHGHDHWLKRIWVDLSTEGKDEIDFANWAFEVATNFMRLGLVLKEQNLYEFALPLLETARSMFESAENLYGEPARFPIQVGETLTMSSEEASMIPYLKSFIDETLSGFNDPNYFNDASVTSSSNLRMILKNDWAVEKVQEILLRSKVAARILKQDELLLDLHEVSGAITFALIDRVPPSPDEITGFNLEKETLPVPDPVYDDSAFELPPWDFAQKATLNIVSPNLFGAGLMLVKA